jgi:hypothetical protein
MRQRNMARLASCIALLVMAVIAGQPAQAEKIANDTAVFAALDKVTARVSELEIDLDETTMFGALKITPRACYTRQPTERPRTSVFVEIDEIQLNGNEKRIFTGWMFAESPGVHGVEHPVFDVWLTNCKTSDGSASAESR